MHTHNNMKTAMKHEEKEERNVLLPPRWLGEGGTRAPVQCHLRSKLEQEIKFSLKIPAQGHYWSTFVLAEHRLHTIGVCTLRAVRQPREKCCEFHGG